MGNAGAGDAGAGVAGAGDVVVPVTLWCRCRRMQVPVMQVPVTIVSESSGMSLRSLAKRSSLVL